AYQLVGAALERIVDRQRLGVGEWQVLHHDDTSDAAARIDPEERIVNAAPAETPGRTLAGRLIGGDQEAETPFVFAVVDEGEVRAARQRGFERRHRDCADM